MRYFLRLPVLLAALLAAAPACALAGEIVNLQNGFTLRCDHHARVDGHVRLYMSAGESSYLDLRPEEIADIAAAPDLPPAADHKSAAPAPAQPEAPLTAADLHQMLSNAGSEHNVNVDLLASVVKAESGGNPRAVSRAGARGLMQLMPATASDLGVENSFHPKENVRGGAAYLDLLLTRYHDNLALALAAYNAGPAAVDRYHGIPPYRETRAYVARVIHEFNHRVRMRQAEAAALHTTASR